MDAAAVTSLPNALDHLGEITDDVDGMRLAVFLDYDGTLTPIVDDPAEAHLSDAARAAVVRLARLTPVAIISGRDLDDVATLVGAAHLVVAGSHGFDIRGPGWEHQHPGTPGLQSDLDAVAAELHRRLDSVPGMLIERKGFAVAVHTRRTAAADHDRIAGEVAEVATRHPGLRVTGGKMIHEFRPDLDWDKGRAVRFVADQLDLAQPDVRVLYLGDDETDEDALREIRDDGVGIVVGRDPRPTAAGYRLTGPGEVVAFLSGLADAIEARGFTDPWSLTFDAYAPSDEGRREALCTLGNGYVATRGALAEVRADGTHYPGTYFAGVFNRLTSSIGDREVSNEDIVNAPNWTWFEWRPVGGEWIRLGDVEVLAHRVRLDLRAGVLERTTRLRDAAGRTTRHVERRLVSMDDRHLAALEVTLEAENWSGDIEIRSGVDGDVANAGVARYRGLENRHLATTGRDDRSDVVVLTTETISSHVVLAVAAATRLREGTATSRRCEIGSDHIAEVIVLNLEAGQPVVFDKVVALHTSRDSAVGNLADDACARVRKAGDFTAVLEPHRVAWRHIWNRFDVSVATVPSTEMTLNLHTFHLAQVVSKHSADLDVGIPARGLHGEAYRGHVFWDELFIVPFLALRLPGLARGHLMYRYRRLPQARRAARAAGHRGAMFPWQSASTGREETQQLHLNPRSGRWLPDASHLQRHINAAVIYDIWQYYEATGDMDFMSFHGAEMICEVALFWSSIAVFDPGSDRYRIRGVMGPDEYHERFADRAEPGLDDNAYTNVMAVWCLERGLRILSELAPRRAAELRERLGIDAAELERWEHITRRMRIAFHDGVISQFDGYERLVEFDWEGYRDRYGDISRLDRILEAEGDTTDRYRLSKQADVLMLFYLFSAEELQRLFGQLGYRFEPAMIPATIEYYLARTAHGSTLSRVVEAWVSARRQRPRSWNTFLMALRSDLFDVQGGTTAEGIHLGAVAGSLDIIQRCYTGIEPRDGVLWLNPRLPPELPSMSLDVRFRGHWVSLEFAGDAVEVSVQPRPSGAVDIGYGGRVHRLAAGEHLVLTPP